MPALRVYCEAKVHCQTCRDTSAEGQAWRESLHSHLKPSPVGGVDWECPYGYAWQSSPPGAPPPTAEETAARELERKAAEAKLLATYRALWAELHEKEDPNEAWLKDWIGRIPGKCGCGNDVTEFVKAHPPDFSRDGWFHWTCELHNDTNQKLGRAVFPLPAARARWGR